jgi:lipopolysaccharide export system permease protein
MIVTNYIFIQSIKSVFVSTLVFVSVIWLSQSFNSIKLIINNGANLLDFFLLSAYSLPSWLLIALPFGTFAGCMISYLKLQNDKEIIVMKSAGLSEIQISKPAILVSIISALILSIISHFILPNSYKSFKTLQNEIRNSSDSLILKDNVFIELNENQTIFIGGSVDNNLSQIFIQDKTDPLNLNEYYAKNGLLNINENLFLTLKNGTKIVTDNQGRSTILKFDKYNIEIKSRADKGSTDRVVEYNEYSFFELLELAEKNNNKKGKLLAEANYRNTITLSPIVFIIFLMITILKDNFSRKISIYKKTLSISLILIIQTLFIIIKNTVHSNSAILPLMYLFPVCLIIIGLFYLQKNQKFSKMSITKETKTVI